jgi:hypothetical protein
MGLDMYLIGEKFYLPDAANGEDGYDLRTKTLSLGYWRKHPNLHGYIVNTFADGIDECQQIDLSAADIQKILAAVEADDLPHTEGFFFGVSDGSEKQETLDIFRSALEWISKSEPQTIRSVHYRASW